MSVMTPMDVHAISEDDLREHVNSVLAQLNDPTAATRIAKIAPFITAGVLMRLHNLVVEARQNNNLCGGWSKQATLARVVGCFTGVHMKQSDAEYIGNAQDYFLSHHAKGMSKAISAQRMRESRARRSGKPLPVDHESRVLELQLQLYKCKFGGVPRSLISRDPERVPFRTIEHADDVNRQLQQQVVDLKESQQYGQQKREMQHNLNALCAVVDAERRARKQAEREMEHARAAHDFESSEVAARMQEMKHKVRASDDECRRMSGQVARLGGQICSAHVEVARARAREEQLRIHAEQQAMEMTAAAECASEATAARMQELKRRLRAADDECRRVSGQVARLGSQLSAAHVEVARAREREEQLRIDAIETGALAAHEKAEAVAKVTNRLRSVQSEMRTQTIDRQKLEGQMQRLGTQLGVALVEAARAAESAKEAHTTAEVLTSRLRVQEQEAEEKLQHLRLLKAQMAKRARAADRRAGKADTFRVALNATRQKLRDVVKELNRTKVHLNLNVSYDFAESDSCSSADDDDDSDASDCSSDRGAAAEKEAAAHALQQARSMPTWRCIRGKGNGKGEAKMEWGTRVIIYSLLAMMVPPSAVGMAIVAIVRRTAPWLKPAAPTYETVKQCRFELRFVEEVCYTPHGFPSMV